MKRGWVYTGQIPELNWWCELCNENLIVVLATHYNCVVEFVYHV